MSLLTLEYVKGEGPVIMFQSLLLISLQGI